MEKLPKEVRQYYQNIRMKQKLQDQADLDERGERDALALQLVQGVAKIRVAGATAAMSSNATLKRPCVSARTLPASINVCAARGLPPNRRY